MRRARPALPTLLLLAATAAAQSPPPAPDGAVERWYALEVAGVTSGYLHETVAATADGGAETTLESELVLNRLGGRVELAERTIEREDAAGHLLSLHSEQRSSRETTLLDVAVGAGTITVRTAAGGRQYERTLAEARVLLGPEGLRRLSAARFAAGDARLDYALFEPSLEAVVAATRRRTAALAAGASTQYRVDEVLEGLPASHLLLDADGHVLEETESSPFGDLHLVAATEAVRAAVAQGATLPAEVYARTLVRANLRLPEPREVEALRVRIDLRDREGVLPALDLPGERVLERGADHVVLEVTAPVAPEGRADRAPPAPAGGRADTQANAVLQADDPAVVALAAELRVRGAGPYRQARALQDWVATHVQFDPGLGLVPASEAVRDRRGSCLASAVLLASLARALDIPARVVVGYAYVANVFAGHAWTEIQSGGRWLPLDAALYRPGPADAARIALARQFGEPGAGLAEVAGLLGHERIRVLAYRLHGRWTEVADGAAPYELRPERYRNPWLGLEVERPEGFRFAALDATYPDSTVLALLADDGSQLRIRVLNGDARATTPAQVLAQAGFVGRLVPVHVAAHAALRVRTGPRAALAFRQGADLWLVTAEGPRALSAFGPWLGQLRLAPAPTPQVAARAAR